jgi:hypothetical protein
MKIKKKEVRTTIENALKLTLVKFGLSPELRKIKKAIKNASREIGDEVKSELKRKTKDNPKKGKTPKKRKTRKPSTV